MSKKEYICLLPVNHDGEQYQIGEPIFLTEKQAAPLFAVNALDGEPESLLAAGTSSGESTAAADALAEQTDKETNQDPLNNKDGGDATLGAQTTAAASTNIEEANGPAAAEGNASATPEAQEASAPGAEGNLTPASADAVQDPVDPAPAVDSTAGGEGQTILDPAATPLDGAATGVVAAPVAAVAPAPANPAPAAPASKKTRKATAAK